MPPQHRTRIFSGISLAGPVCWLISPRIFDNGCNPVTFLGFLSLVLIAAPIVTIGGVVGEVGYVISYPVRKLVDCWGD